jgi:hypothetical protein
MRGVGDSDLGPEDVLPARMLKHHRRTRRRLERLLPLHVTDAVATKEEIRLVSKRVQIGLRGEWRVVARDKTLFGWSTPDVQSHAAGLRGLEITGLDFDDTLRWHGDIRSVHFGNGVRLDTWFGDGRGQSLELPGWR